MNYLTSKYCAPVWCRRSAHIRLINCVLNDAQRIITGFLCPTPTKYLLNLSGIQPGEIHLQGATFSIANCGCLDPDHILHGHLLRGSQNISKKRLKSRRTFVPFARKLLNSLSEMGNRTVQWTNIKWSKEYSKNMSAIHSFTFRVITRPIDTNQFAQSILNQIQPPTFWCRTLLVVDARKSSRSTLEL